MICDHIIVVETVMSGEDRVKQLVEASAASNAW